MNKNQYRLLYNAVRNQLMVVPEHASCKGGTSINAIGNTTSSANLAAQSIAFSVASHYLAQLKRLSFAALRLLALPAVVVMSAASLATLSALSTLPAQAADLAVDTSAPANQRPLITNAANGVPVVNIQTPSAAGVSHNTYSQFDVTSQGVILNNSSTNVSTQLGGYIQGNPYLPGSTARVILNEVNSSNPSLLHGYIEVAGSRAQVIVANPSGISCDGCGFINTSRATLTTGIPLMSGGDLIGYRVTGGVINFLGAGLDTANTNYTDVIARAVQVNAGLFANKLNVITGSNQVNVASAQNGTDAYISSITPIAGTGSAPTFAIDVAALGGMYAGKIHLIGTEAGLGVRNAGSISATSNINPVGAAAGEVRIDINGQIMNNNANIASTGRTDIKASNISNTGGAIAASNTLNINATSVTGDGKLLSSGDASIALQSDYTQQASGQLQADGNLTFSTTGTLTNQGSILAGNALNLTASTINNQQTLSANGTVTLNATHIDNSATGEISGLTTQINATNNSNTGTLTNRGLIDGSDTFINANTVNNIGTGNIFGDHIAIAANTITNNTETVNGTTTAATIAARNRLDIGATTITNREHALIYSAGDMAIAGGLDANHQATTASGQAQTATLNNNSATIEALGNVSLNVADINNTNEHFSTHIVQLSSTAIQEFQLAPGDVYHPNDISNRYAPNQITLFDCEPRCMTINATGDTSDQEIQYDYTRTVTETQIASSDPAKLLSGGNMQINANNLLNNNSTLIAGGALTATIGTLTNSTVAGQHITTDSGTSSYYYRIRRSGRDRQGISVSGYNPAATVQAINLTPTTYQQNTSTAGATSGTTVANLSTVTLPNNSLFSVNPNPNAGYLIETNPRFANYRTWLSSDYMLSQLNLDPTFSLKRLGDGFYEQKLIREQINQLTGRRFLVGFANEEAQYQALMNNGVTSAKQFNLQPGIALSAAQVAQLTSDILWLVQQEVVLPAQYDSAGKLIQPATKTQALVPHVYVAVKAGDLNEHGQLLSGALISANSTQLTITGDLNNSNGTIAGRTLLALNANNVNNLGGRLTATDINVHANNDLNNLGGTIDAQHSLIATAGHDLNVISSTSTQSNATGSRTNINRVAGLYVTGDASLPLAGAATTGLLIASAGHDMHLDGAQIVNNATGSTSTTQLNAGHDVSLGTVKTSEQNNITWNSKNHLNQGSSTDNGSSITSNGNITLGAGHDANLKAASIDSSQGNLNVNTANSINITAGQASHNLDSAHQVKSKGFLSKTTRSSRDTINSTDSIGSSLSADSITLNAGKDINVQGSNVVATNDTNLNAGNNVNITAAQNTLDETHFKDVKKTGLMSSGGVGFTVGSRQLTNTNDTQSVTNSASTVGSVQGNTNITSGKTYTQTGSDVLAPQGDVNILAQQVNIQAAQNTSTNTQTTKFKQTGITLAVTSPVISAIQTAQQMVQAASQTKDTRMQALAAGTTALAASNAADAIIAGNTPQLDNNGLQVLDDHGNNTAQNPANQVGGVNISISLGTSQNSSTSTQTSSTAQSNHVTAGNNINIKATGAGSASDINVIGSNINAANNVSLKADDVINLLAAQNVDTLKSKNSGSSASLGVSFGTDGFLVTAGLSGNKGKANGNGNTWTETVVQSGNKAGDKVNLQSGTDTNIIGSQVIGNQVIANVGTSGTGNLNIISLQDSSTYTDKQSSAGFSISVPIYGAGSVGGSINASKSSTKSNYQSVNEQAGIFAGNGGFQVNVNGNTNLTGAVMASANEAVKQNLNSLTTQTLTTSNIENKAEYSAKGINLGAGVNVGLTENNQPIAGVTKSIGWGSLSDDANSVTLSGISGGKVSITDNAAQQTQTSKDSATTVATLNRDVKAQFATDTQGNVTAIAVDSQGNNLAHTINPIFNAQKVQQELDAQMQITQAFDKAQQQFRLEINRKVDQAKANKEAVADMLKNQDLNEDQRLDLINQGLNAQKEIEQLENMGLVFSAVAGGLSAPTNSIGGIMANSLAPEMANQIGQYFKDHGTEGSAPHILAHGVLAGAVAALGGNNPMGAALSAMGGELAAPLVADLLYGKPSEELNAEQKSTVSAIASLGGIAVGASVDSGVNNIAQANLAAQNAVDNNWGEVGHYSTMATVLYLAGFSPKDAKAIALAAWGPDTDKRSAMSSNSVFGSIGSTNNSQAIHLLDGEKDPSEVIAKQQSLAKEVRVILRTIKQYENDPAKKAEYLTKPDVQNTLHSFGDAFAHVQKNGTHYPVGQGHAGDGKEPDNPQTHPDAYRNYVNSIFNSASQVTVIPRVSNSAITNVVNQVTSSTSETAQIKALNNTIGSVSSSTSSSLVNSPVGDCGYAGNCFNKPIGSQVNPQINSIYGVKK